MLVRRALVALVALLGLAALVAGVGMRTAWLPEDTATASADLSDGGPVSLTAPGVMEMRPGPVTATLTGEGEVHLARMREADAQAWVEGAQHLVLTGLRDENSLSTEAVDGEATVPDPAGSVMWLDGESGQDEVTLTWEDRPGRYLLVAAGDGTQAPQRLTLTWPVEVSTPWATPLVALGVVLLLVAAALAFLLVRRGSRRRSDPDATNDTAADVHASRAGPAAAPPEPTGTRTEEVRR